jgi:aryl-phospho-beta-D-glucosidase BglC (GH1 family)
MQPFSGSVSHLIFINTIANLLGASQVIGNTTDPTAATTAQFGAFWKELASRFAHNPKVVFGINNEPHSMVNAIYLSLKVYS